MWTIIRYTGRIILNTGLFLVIFAVLSIQGVLIEDMQWKWAVDKWNYVSEGGLREDQLRKKIDNSKFSKGSYKMYINPGNNSNLAASDWASACVFKDRFYMALPNSFYTIKKYSTKSEKSSLTLSNSVLIGGKRYVLSINEENFYALKLSKKYTAALEENPVPEFTSLGFSEKADYLYNILKKQQQKKITSKELAMMAWGTKQGILLDYKNGTAYFADDSGSGDTVYVYEQTGEGERNLIFQYEDSYQGLGAGRFIMDHYFVGVENFQIVTCDLETGEIRYRSEEMGAIDGSINYIKTLKGNYYICYIYKNTLYCWDFYGDRPLQPVNMHIDEGGAVTGLFCYGNHVYVTHESGDYNWHRYELDKEE